MEIRSIIFLLLQIYNSKCDYTDAAHKEMDVIDDGIDKSSLVSKENGKMNISEIENDTASSDIFKTQNKEYENSIEDYSDNDFSESAFTSNVEKTLAENLSTKEHGYRTKTIVKEKVKTNVENMHEVFQNELEDLSPETNKRLSELIKSSQVDRSRYRDIFIIKKRITTDGNRKIVTFDIKERIIPKPLKTFNIDPYIKIMLYLIIIMLSGLVFMITMKTYQSIVKNGIIGKNEELKNVYSSYERSLMKNADGTVL